VEVTRHSSELGSWEMVRAPAAPAVRGLVRNYTGFAESTPGPLRRREVPHRDITLIISFGPRFEISDPARPEAPAERRESFVAGLHDRPVVVEHAGESSGVELRLPPLSAHVLLGLPMQELTNGLVSLDDVLPEAGELVERLAGAPGWEERFALVDAALRARLGQSRRPAREVAWAWRTLEASAGRVPIGALASELGWSHRRLIARFREQVGLAPKTFARVLRFDHVVRRLQGVDEVRWSEVAFDCGYYDQAHLNRDFREFAGTTPTEFLARRLPDSGGVAAA
jgi:AraC-like DNA-binding protein